jgi:hypothetical protein
MSGVPPHTLTLQEGYPVILLRNMLGGLANGTWLIVVKLMQHIIDAEIATGPNKGRRVSFLASTSLLLTPKGCLLLSVGDRSHCGPHLP